MFTWGFWCGAHQFFFFNFSKRLYNPSDVGWWTCFSSKPSIDSCLQDQMKILKEVDSSSKKESDCRGVRYTIEYLTYHFQKQDKKLMNISKNFLSASEWKCVDQSIRKSSSKVVPVNSPTNFELECNSLGEGGEICKRDESWWFRLYHWLVVDLMRTYK